MTIPEAVQLVLQAASLGQGGEVFVLDMGAPIRIEDLAKDLIELSGLELGRDLDIVYTGLRPGEKLFEELAATGESYASTRHDKIVRMRNGEGGVDPRILRDAVQELLQLATRGSEVQMRDKLREIVPEYAADPDVGTGTS
jgi:FlaA1/EpsC-like NDP-sugar epimerase